MNVRAVIKGALTFIPGAQALLPKAIASANPPPVYYYGVWLKHVALLAQHGLYDSPVSVAELGPGDSLGLGLASLLSGVDRYYGLDVVAHTNPQQNLEILEKQLEYFKQRAPRPSQGWPEFDHLLDERKFASSVLTEGLLSASMTPQRVQHIRNALTHPKGQSGPITIAYRVPWNDAAVIERNSIDLIVSQAVLEHVIDIYATYRALYQWLKPGGVMSHQIDLRSHNLAKAWNGHRAISEPMWKLMSGNRPYLINREPWSGHERALKECGFELVSVLKRVRTDGITRSHLTKRWQDISDDDLTCAEVFVLARKPA